MKKEGVTFKILLILVVSLYFVSCATITVNVCFPAEEVREAYTSLEEELLQAPEEEANNKKSEENIEPERQESIAQPQSISIYPEEPQLSSTKIITIRKGLSLDIYEYAWAQDNFSRQITNEVKKMPDVVDAYRRRGRRLSEVNKLLSDGEVGQGNNGLLVRRGSLTDPEKSTFNDENGDRKIIISGMAKAIVKVNGLEPTQQNINRVVPEAGEQFAAVRRSEAKPGWWIQLPNDKWVQK